MSEKKYTEKATIKYENFQPIKGGGKFQGLGNLMKTEISRWRHSIAWWLQIVAVLGFCNGITLMAMIGSEGQVGIGMMMFPLMSGMYVAFSAMTMIQGAIVKEKVEGTAAWVLSKPVSRVAFMTSKFVTNCISMTIALVLFPWIVAYIMFAGMGEAIDPFGTVLAIGIFWTYCMFWLTMALMLGSIFNSRRPVMTVMFTVFFLFIAAGSLEIPQAVNPLFWWPGSGISPNPQFPQSIISNVLQGTYYVNLGPLIMGVLSILFLAIAFMRFSKVEL